MRTKLVLVVEDSLPDAELIQQALTGTDPPCEFAVVRNGDDAIRYLRKEKPFESARRPDLVLLDLNIPGTDGREVLQRIRDHRELDALPIVVLTTSESPRDVDDMYRLHANSFVTKPATYDLFAKTMKTLHQYWFRVATLPEAE